MPTLLQVAIIEPRPPASLPTARQLADSKAKLLKEWKTRVRYLPPADRLTWLQQAAGLVAFGPRQRRHLERELLGVRTRLEQSAPTPAWQDDAWHRGAAFPVPGMVLTAAGVRNGLQPPTPRYTSPLAVEVEDQLDSMTSNEAFLYDYPASPSAVAIQQIRVFKGKPGRQRTRRPSDRTATLTTGPAVTPTELAETLAELVEAN